MTSSPVRAPFRGFVRAIALGALAASAVVFPALPAAAHDELVASEPAAGATVAAMPAALVLTFSAPVLADLGGTQIQATDASGASLVDGAPLVAENVVTQSLVAGARGVVVVLWRVVSEDGHPVAGEFSFTVAGSPTAAPEPTTSAGGTPAPPASPPQPSSPEASAEPASDARPASPVPGIVLGALLLAAAAAVVYLLVARGRRPPRAPAEAPPDR